MLVAESPLLGALSESSGPRLPLALPLAALT